MPLPEDNVVQIFPRVYMIHSTIAINQHAEVCASPLMEKADKFFNNQQAEAETETKDQADES